MALATTPLFVAVPNVSWSGAILTANTAVDGTGTVGTAFTAGSNGGYVQKLRAKALGTNTGSVLRIFINNGLTNATAANNVLIAELALPATTASNSAAIGPDFEYPLDFAIPAGYTITVCIGTTVATGWNFCVIGGNY